MSEREHTQAFELPPPEAAESPATYQVAERTLFGVTPTSAVAMLAVLALAAAIGFLVEGRLILGLLFLLGALFLAGLFLEQALHRRDSAVDRAAAGAVDRSRALAGFAGASARAWAGASREVTRVRLELRRLGRERTRVQLALGAAAYAENDEEMTTLRARLRELDARRAESERAARVAVDRARRRTSKERLAVASTEIRQSGDARS